MTKRSKQFEVAVRKFVEALDPSAEVLFDHKVPDRDTGTLRQVDVWVNATYGGHIPISILVSCKDYRRKVNIAHIGTFCDEVRSTGASTGVLYSSSGFSRAALAKAKSNGLACCRLYQDEPADIPECLILSWYLCSPTTALELIEPLPLEGFRTWGDVFNMEVSNETGKATVLDVIADQFRQHEAEAVEASGASGQFPGDWIAEHTFKSPSGRVQTLRIRLRAHWRRFRGKVEAHLLNGSYCFSNNSFVGSQAGPAVDMLGPAPGPGWEEIDTTSDPLPKSLGFAIRYSGDVRGALLQGLGKELLPSSPPRARA
jgi:hypothetical protein